MKYIVCTTLSGSMVPVLFDEGIDHIDAVPNNILDVVSAGFFITSAMEAIGESVTLGIKSRGDVDTTLIRSMLAGISSQDLRNLAAFREIQQLKRTQNGMV